MGRPSRSSREVGDGATRLNSGPWTLDEDRALIEYMVGNNGHHGNWRRLPKLAGINRCGKSCRLRWNNYLRPDINRSAFTDEEDRIIIHLHSIMGNRWSAIARELPGRTDNDIKNRWNTHLGKKLLAMGIDPRTHSLLPNDLHPDFIRLQADLANLFAKLNRRVTSWHSAFPLWSNMTAPLEEEGAFQPSYTGRDYVVDDGTVDLQKLATVSAPCLDGSDPNMMASRDVTMTVAEPGAPGSSGNWTVSAPLNEPPANMAASHLSPKCGRSMSSGDAAVITETESTVSRQFGNINNADLGGLEEDNHEFWKELLE